LNRSRLTWLIEASVVLSVPFVIRMLAGLPAPLQLHDVARIELEVNLLLAKGTLALAIAALVQAVDAIEAARKGDHTW
jgi:hypothetical protein